jgi:ferric-dicitrate binding protein FerR (iron transport regulator)
MRITLLILTAAAVLAAGAHAAPNGPAKRKCTEEGKIVKYLRTVTRSPCATTVVDGRPLYRNERVRTGTAGQLTFSTKHLTQCRLGANSDATFFPRPNVALRLDVGTIWCLQTPGLGARIVTPTGVVKITGTLLGVETDRTTTMVKVADGDVVVLARSGIGPPAQLGAGSQVVVPKGAPADPVDGFEPTVEDEQAITALTLDAPEATLGQVRTAILKAGSAVGVIGETHTLVARAESKLASTKVRFIDWSSVDNFLADENGTARLPEAGVKVVVLVGSLDTLAPAIQRLRDDLDTAIQILVLPPAQVAP